MYTREGKSDTCLGYHMCCVSLLLWLPRSQTFIVYFSMDRNRKILKNFGFFFVLCSFFFFSLFSPPTLAPLVFFPVEVEGNSTQFKLAPLVIMHASSQNRLQEWPSPGAYNNKYYSLMLLVNCSDRLLFHGSSHSGVQSQRETPLWDIPLLWHWGKHQDLPKIHNAS